MSTYTVTITPDNEAMASATIIVRLDSPDPHVREITVRVGSDGMPISHQLAEIDFQDVMETVVLLSQGRLPRAAASTDTKARPTADTPPGTAPSRQRPPANLPAGVPSDLGVMYWRLGSAAKVAEHYAVPRQIASGWVRLLRQGGKLPSPWPKKAAPSAGQARRQQR